MAVDLLKFFTIELEHSFTITVYNVDKKFDEIREYPYIQMHQNCKFILVVNEKEYITFNNIFYAVNLANSLIQEGV